MSAMDIFIFGMILLSTLLLLTMVVLGYHGDRVSRWIHLIVGVMTCLLVYLAFVLIKPTHVIGTSGFLESTALFF